MERRKDSRYTVSPESVLVAVLYARQERRFLAKLLDVSRSGMNLKSPQALAPGRQILVVMDRLAIRGKVRRCQRSDAGKFTIGVKITAMELAAEIAA